MSKSSYLLIIRSIIRLTTLHMLFIPAKRLRLKVDNKICSKPCNNKFSIQEMVRKSMFSFKISKPKTGKTDLVKFQLFPSNDKKTKNIPKSMQQNFLSVNFYMWTIHRKAFEFFLKLIDNSLGILLIVFLNGYSWNLVIH